MAVCGLIFIISGVLDKKNKMDEIDYKVRSKCKIPSVLTEIHPIINEYTSVRGGLHFQKISFELRKIDWC